jgi:hypothetical protein
MSRSSYWSFSFWTPPPPAKKSYVRATTFPVNHILLSLTILNSYVSVQVM